MSDEMKNCCPPETTAPKMEVHDASEGSKDIKPKMISTAHKQLSKDEFQRKVAMAAYIKAAEDMGLNTMEKEALIGALLSGGSKLIQGARALPGMYRAYRGAAPLARMGGAMGEAASKGYGMTNPLAKTIEGAKSLFRTGMLPGATKSWANAPMRAAVDYGKFLMNPRHLVAPAAGALTYGASSAMPYVGGALQRAGEALGGTVGAMTGTGGGAGGQGFGNVGNLGLLGAGVGAIGGALMPGEEEYEDEDGRIRKRRGSMLAGALRGAGMGGLAGAGVGAGMDYFGKQSAAQNFGATIANLQKQAMDPAQLKAMMHGSPRGSLMSQLPPATARRPATPAMSPAIQKGLLAGGMSRPQTPQASPFAR